MGHEGVGIVEATGSDVKTMHKGDRVGWGYQTDSCGTCLQCLRGHETYCPDRAIYGQKNTDQGSFATHAVWREAFLHKVPEGMSDEAAAPLQCGGATVYAALQGVRPTDTVGILGVGGLGHLAIQFAAKLGCRVVVLSGSDRKREQAMQLGAHKFIVMGKDQKSEELGDGWTIDRLLVTASAQPAWDTLLPMMSPNSQVYPLTAPSGNLVIPYAPLILQGIRIQGSLVAPRAVHREMLMFAARHNIAPIVEKFPMTVAGITEAMEKLDKGSVHYRAVLIHPQS